MNYPSKILIELYPDKWFPYNKQYEHEGGGCYYNIADGMKVSVVTDGFISLYPDGHLTFLWNGKENILNNKWKEKI